MAQETKGPKARIETNAGSEPTKGPARQDEDRLAEGPSTREPAGVRRAWAWVRSSVRGHENATLFGLVGLLAAILVFVIGPWKTLFIAVLVTLGVAFGQMLDGNPRIFNFFLRRFDDSEK